jgi:hypothetical protein
MQVDKMGRNWLSSTSKDRELLLSIKNFKYFFRNYPKLNILENNLALALSDQSASDSRKNDIMSDEVALRQELIGHLERMGTMADMRTRNSGKNVQVINSLNRSTSKACCIQ